MQRRKGAIRLLVKCNVYPTLVMVTTARQNTTSGDLGAAASAAQHVSAVEDEQGPLVGGPEVGDIYSVGTDFCFRMLDLRRLGKEVDKLVG